LGKHILELLNNTGHFSLSEFTILAAISGENANKNAGMPSYFYNNNPLNNTFSLSAASLEDL